jgi:hypothetical protein
MSILLGILLYVLFVAFLCTLTSINHLDVSGPGVRLACEKAPANAAVPAGGVSAREAHG